MLVYNDLSEIPKITQSALTIGNFDGIHHGHLEILKKVELLSSKNDSESVVITFDPHPRAVLSPHLLENRYLITILDKKIEIFDSYSIDHLLILPFDRFLAHIEAERFLKDIIIKYFRPHDIVIGHNHRFGYNRLGDAKLIQAYSADNSYILHQQDQVSINGMPVSSSSIRKLIKNNHKLLHIKLRFHHHLI